MDFCLFWVSCSATSHSILYYQQISLKLALDDRCMSRLLVMFDALAYKKGPRENHTPLASPPFFPSTSSMPFPPTASGYHCFRPMKLVLYDNFGHEGTNYEPLDWSHFLPASQSLPWQSSAHPSDRSIAWSNLALLQLSPQRCQRSVQRLAAARVTPVCGIRCGHFCAGWISRKEKGKGVGKEYPKHS